MKLYEKSDEGYNIRHSKAEDENMIKCQVSESAKCNFLELVNLAIHRLGNLHIDQCLCHTGGQIQVITAGIGVYKVCPDIQVNTK